jgi:chloramphenicol-sensitive protein RarD
MNKGILYALGAYGLWGFLPSYWKLLKGVPPLEIMSHRIVWGLVILLGLLA